MTGDEIRKRVVDALEATLSTVVDTQWSRAQAGVASQRRRRPQDSPDALVDQIIRNFVRDLAAIGAASGGVTT